MKEREAAAGDDGLVIVAEVVKAVGLKGEIKLFPLIDWYDPLLETDFLCWGNGRPFEVLKARQAGGALVVVAGGIVDRNAAEAAVGRSVGFRRADYLDPAFPRPAGGLAFRYVGREVEVENGEVVGTVEEVRRWGGQMVLVVETGGRQVLIPAVEPILRPDDGIEGRLVIDPPEGLLDVAGD